MTRLHLQSDCDHYETWVQLQIRSREVARAQSRRGCNHRISVNQA